MNSSAARLNITANRLLAALPGSALSLIEPHFTSVSLATGTIVHQVGDKIDHIYFPIDGIASLQMVMRDGRAIDTAIVGRDGALGRMASLDPHRSVVRCVVRSAITAFKISAVKFRGAAAKSIAVRMIDIHCNDRLLSQTQTSAARYALLSLDTRLAGMSVGCIEPSCKRQHFAQTARTCGNAGGSAHVGFGSSIKTEGLWDH